MTVTQMNFSGYVGHVTISVECLLLRSVTVRIRFSVWLVWGVRTRICATLGCHCHTADINTKLWSLQ